MAGMAKVIKSHAIYYDFEGKSNYLSATRQTLVNLQDFYYKLGRSRTKLGEPARLGRSPTGVSFEVEQCGAWPQIRVD